MVKPTGEETAVRRELTFLLRTAVPGGTAPEPDGGLDGFDWTLFLAAAFRHRVAALAGATLFTSGLLEPDSRLEYVQDALTAARVLNERRNAVLLPEAARLVGLLRRAGIRVAVRKGAYLAPVVYGDIGLRPMNDIDLFVEREAARDAATIVEAEGYRPGHLDRYGRLTPLSRRQTVFWNVHVNNVPTLHRMRDDTFLRSVAVDICFGLFLPASGCYLAPGHLLDACVEAPVAGRNLPVFRPEHFLIDVAAHLHKESTTLRYIERGKHQRLLQYVDILALVRANPDLDWDVLVATASDAGAARNVYFGLANTEHLFPSTVPGPVLNRLAAAGGVDEGFLLEYGAIDLSRPLTWSSRTVADRLFTDERPTSTSQFPV
jgi:hypothetical protein